MMPASCRPFLLRPVKLPPPKPAKRLAGVETES
jgi:hypothetical protein